MKRAKKRLTLIVFIFLAMFLINHAAYSAPTPFYGTVIKVEQSGKRIKIKSAADGRHKTVKYTASTKFFKKTKARQTNFKTTPSAISAGDIILVLSKNPKSPTPTAYEVWERKALLVKNGMVQTETFLGGEIIKVSPGGKDFIIQTFDGRKKKINLNYNSKIIINNLPGKPHDVKRGRKFAAMCRWPGFNEDEPDELQVVELLDSRSYVVRKMQEKYGPLLSEGMVQAVDRNTRMIRIGTSEGLAVQSAYGKKTRWITATPRIKQLGDFVGYEVAVFGTPNKERPGAAALVMNLLAVNSFFENIITQGSIPGTVSVLAFGKLLYIDSSIMVVEYKGQEVKCRLVGKTTFIRKDKKVSWKSIAKGDRVLVKGIYGKTPVALLVVSFGHK